MAKKLSKSQAWSNASSAMVSSAEELVSLREAISDALDAVAQVEGGETLAMLRRHYLDSAEGVLAIAAIDKEVAKYNAAREDMEAAIEGYQDWLDNMPESLQNGATGEMVSACAECEPGDEAEFGAIVIKDDGSIEFNDNFEDLVDIAGDLDNQDLPQGFGKD
jgi:hypothetical protein